MPITLRRSEARQYRCLRRPSGIRAKGALRVLACHSCVRCCEYRSTGLCAKPAERQPLATNEWARRSVKPFGWNVAREACPGLELEAQMWRH